MIIRAMILAIMIITMMMIIIIVIIIMAIMAHSTVDLPIIHPNLVCFKSLGVLLDVSL